MLTCAGGGVHSNNTPIDKLCHERNHNANTTAANANDATNGRTDEKQSIILRNNQDVEIPPLPSIATLMNCAIMTVQTVEHQRVEVNQ